MGFLKAGNMLKVGDSLLFHCQQTKAMHTALQRASMFFQCVMLDVDKLEKLVGWSMEVSENVAVITSFFKVLDMKLDAD